MKDAREKNQSKLNAIKVEISWRFFIKWIPVRSFFPHRHSDNRKFKCKNVSKRWWPTGKIEFELRKKQLWFERIFRINEAEKETKKNQRHKKRFSFEKFSNHFSLISTQTITKEFRWCFFPNVLFRIIATFSLHVLDPKRDSNKTNFIHFYWSSSFIDWQMKNQLWTEHTQCARVVFTKMKQMFRLPIETRETVFAWASASKWKKWNSELEFSNWPEFEWNNFQLCFLFAFEQFRIRN